jgi:hypothetical protein
MVIMGKMNFYLFQTLKDSFSIFPTDATTKFSICKIFLKYFNIFRLSTKKMLQKDIPQNSSFNSCITHIND